MKIKKLPLIFFLLAASIVAGAQVKSQKPVTNPTSDKVQTAKSSPAYAEVLLRKTEVLSELESLLVEYTEEYPKVKELRYESGLLQKESDRLTAVSAADAFKLSAALGKLMVRKCELETDLWILLKQYNDQHPDSKRAKRKVEIFEAAIADILK